MPEARISFWPGMGGERIPRELYGVGLDQGGSGVYDGVWVGRDSGTPHVDGLRLDVLAALKHARVPFLSWPGVPYSQDYAWRMGVGEVDARIAGVNCWSRQVDPNTFGTDAFLGLCGALDCVGMFTCNVGTGTVGSARGWVEYCNFGGGSPLAMLRERHGGGAPYGVRDWGVGAVPWGAGGRYNAAGYAAAYGRYAAAMKGMDGGIGLTASGADLLDPKLADWNHDFCAAMPHSDLLDHLGVRCDFCCGGGADFSDGAFGAMFARVREFEEALDRVAGLLDYFYPDKRVGLALAGWGARHPEASVDNGMEQARTLRDALLAGSVWNALNRRAGRISYAVLNQAVNGLHCLAVTAGREMGVTPTYFAYDLMRRHGGNQLVAQEVSGAGLCVSASRSGKRLWVTVVNESIDQDIAGVVEAREFEIASASGRLLDGEDPRCENVVGGAATVKVRRIALKTAGNEARLVFPRHSLTALSLTLG